MKVRKYPKLKKVSFEKLIFSFLFFSEMFLLLLPAWSMSPLWKVINHENYFKIVLGGSQILFFVFSIIIISIKSIPKNVLLWCFALEIFFSLSLVMTGFRSGSLALVAVPICFCTLFGILKDFSIPSNILTLSFYLLFVWSIAPVIILPFSPLHLKISFFMSETGQLLTFGGFALHRNFYGMVLGIVIILLFIPQLKINKILKLNYFILCMVAVYLCGSRSLMVAVCIALSFMFFFKSAKTFIKRLPILVLVLGVFSIIYQIYKMYSIRPEKTNDDRYELYQGFFEEIKRNPLWGNGEPFLYFSAGYPEGSVAHNFILQLSADYGVVFCSVFLLFLCYLLCKFKFYSRIFLIYVIIWGLFQPYFSYGIPATQILIPLLIGFILDIQHENSLLHSRSL